MRMLSDQVALRVGSLMASALLAWIVALTSASAQPAPASQGKAAAVASSPSTLEEAFRELDRRLPAEEREQFKRKSELEAVTMPSRGLVPIISGEWLKSDRSALRDHLASLGTRHSGHLFVVLGAYRQYLNGAPIEIPRAPNTLEEAFQKLDRLLSAEEREELKGKPEIEAVAFADFRLFVFVGRWFSSGSSGLLDHLRSLGPRHSDYAFVVLGAYWQYLNGRPIEIERYLAGGPNTLEEAFQELDQLLPADEKESFKGLTEDAAVGITHLGLGMIIRNRWFHSRRAPALEGYLTSLGAGHPDDMSWMVLTSYWRHLNGRPIEIEKQGARFADYRVNAEKRRQELVEELNRLNELDKKKR